MFFSTLIYSHFLGDSDESEEEDAHKKRGKLLTQPSAPVIAPPPFILSSGTAAPPPPISPPHCSQRPAEEQTPSASRVYRPTWRGGRCGSDSIACSGEQYLIRYKTQIEFILSAFLFLCMLSKFDTGLFNFYHI